MADTLFLDPPEKLLERFSSSPSGLSNEEAHQRLLKVGPNKLLEAAPYTLRDLFLRQLKNPMMGVLGIAAILSAAIGEQLDALAITLVMGINIGIGFAQEFKAEKALEALKKITAPHAVVIRNGLSRKIPAEELVPGDILTLEEGMRIPADARLLSAQSLSTLESSLTGESLAIQKEVLLKETPKSIGDCTHMVFLGTIVSQGHGLALVVQTGMKTEFGKIAASVSTHNNEQTPLQKNLQKQLKQFTLGTLILVTGLFFIGIFKGETWSQMGLLAISLSVSVIPEGLPAVITLTLALGVQKMAEQKAAIRKLGAAETLGSVNVICTDKTGTLTQNEMTVTHVFLAGEVFDVEGKGYSPTPHLRWEHPLKTELLTAAALCNNAHLLKNDHGWEIQGDPTEGALLTLAAKGLDHFEKLKKTHPLKFENIFDSDRKRMSTVNGQMLWMKGATESVLAVCKNIATQEKNHILMQTQNWSKEGFRVIAFARKKVENRSDYEEKNLEFLGLVAMIDPPREGVKAAIKTCREAGIRVIMVTGDHALTAQAIGVQIGLCTWEDPILSGEDLDKLSTHDLKKALEKVAVVARVSPKHKVQLIELLKQNGHIVAMTGDGINDAPALKYADIGIAMGITGTDVAKEASDIVLMDDHFETIVVAIERGRIIESNILKSIRFLLAANFCEIALISIVFLSTGWIPFLPLQILWMNLLTDSLPALALGVDKGEVNLMKKAPQKSGESAWKAWGELCIVSAISFGLSLKLGIPASATQDHEQFRNFLFSALVLFQLGLVLSARFKSSPIWSARQTNVYLGLSILVSFLFQYLALEWNLLQEFLATRPLPANEWVALLKIIMSALILMEIWKCLRSKRIPLNAHAR